MRRAIVLFLITSAALAQDLAVHEFSLDNGMKFLVVERHDSPRVFGAVMFRVGSVNERPGITGLSHFLEHMMFKGTHVLGITDIEADGMYNGLIESAWEEIRRGRVQVEEKTRKGQPVPEGLTKRVAAWTEFFEQLSKDQKAIIVKDDLWERYMRNGGTSLNASTGEDSTQYFVELPANKLELFFWQESDRMTDCVWREFYSEREVVKEERRLSVESTPTGRINEAFEAMFWEAHPYSWPVVGWMSDLDNFTPADMEEHYRTYYAPNNAVAVFVGDVDPKRVEELAQQYFARIPRGAKTPPPVATKEPEQVGERRMAAEADAQPSIQVQWHTVAARHADEPALSVLEGVLKGKSGRLYKRLVLEKQVALEAGAETDHRRWAGAFAITAKPKEDVDPAEVEREALAVLEELKAQPPTEEEVQKAKNQLLARMVQFMRSNMGMAFIVGRSELSGSWRDVKSQLDAVQKITPEEVSAVAKKYLTAQGRNVLWVRRKGADPNVDPETAMVEKALNQIKGMWSDIKDPAMKQTILQQARQRLGEVKNAELRKKAEDTLNELEKQ
ncbi:MAG: pitrilysin family protein [Planctomycetota bacterium]